MGYLDNSSITVDAVLTKKGREILKDGGSLNITKFTLSDTGVDYSLWNPDDPSGSAYYGEAIENLPQLEANVHSEYNLRNRLISLNQSSIAIPAVTLGGLENGAKTFNEGDEASGQITITLKGFTSNQSLGFTILIQNPNIVTTNATSIGGISGTGVSRVFLPEEDIPSAQEYSITSTTQGSDKIGTFTINPVQQDTAGKQTNIYVVDVETGAYASFVVTNNITKNQTALLSSGGTGATT